MAGFQFVHMETYSRKADARGRSVGFVLQEAAREPVACLHVENPGVPTVVHGVGPAEVAVLHDELVAGAGSVDKKGKRRPARVDQHTLLTVIASHPITSKDMRADPAKAAEVERWQGLVVAWLREQHGDDLVSVVRHDDESHPHLHAYVLPGSSSMKARELHPGVVAKAEAKVAALAEGDTDKLANKKGDRAYKAAMRGWQDDYWLKVGLPCGQTRLGPGGRSLKKPQWKAEQEQVERVALLERRAAEAEARIGRADGALAEAQAERAAALAEAEAARVAAEVAKAEADRMLQEAKQEAAGIVGRARRQAAGIVEKAKGAAARLVEDARASTRSVGVRFGEVLFGLVGQAPAKVEARARIQGAEEEREVAAVRESGLEAEVRELRGEVRAVRKQLTEAMATIRGIATERDDLRQKLQASPDLEAGIVNIGRGLN